MALISQHQIRSILSDGPFTVLAPVNAAFDAVDVPALLDNATALTAVLTRHVVSAKVESGDLENGPVKTLGGEIIIAKVEVSGTETKVSFIWWFAELALTPLVLGSIRAPPPLNF